MTSFLWNETRLDKIIKQEIALAAFHALVKPHTLAAFLALAASLVLYTYNYLVEIFFALVRMAN